MNNNNAKKLRWVALSAFVGALIVLTVNQAPKILSAMVQDVVRSKIDTLENRINESIEQTKEYESQLSITKVELENIKSDLDDLKKDIGELRSDVKKLTGLLITYIESRSE